MQTAGLGHKNACITHQSIMPSSFWTRIGKKDGGADEWCYASGWRSNGSTGDVSVSLFYVVSGPH